MTVWVSRGRDGTLRLEAPHLVYDVLTLIGDVLQYGTDDEASALIVALETWSVAHRAGMGPDHSDDPDDWLDDIEAAVNGPIGLGVPVSEATAKTLAAALTSSASRGPERRRLRKAAS